MAVIEAKRVATDMPGDGAESETPTASGALVSWVMGNVREWRTVRDTAYKDRWDDFYNTWRGKWTAQSKTRRSERSKLISPASMSAVDLTVAEIVEAIFARDEFIDLPEDAPDSAKADMDKVRKELMHDLYEDGIIQNLIEIVLNGALYGTGASKIVIDVEERATAEIVQGALTKVRKEVTKIYPVPIEPGQLVVDPSASRIDDMLGVAHEYRMPLHKVWKRQQSGTYYNTPVGRSYLEYSTENRSEEDNRRGQDPAAFITEWHGLVPTALLVAAVQESRDGTEDGFSEAIDEHDMTEAIITIADEAAFLRGIENPSVMEDRAILAYQHDTVPNRFWGRGVMEKGTHPQKAIDAELRSRIDSLAWVSNPMLAGDITKLPPRMNLNVWPGKFWGTRGDPNSILREFRFGDINASTFEHTAELERMLQDATGARDPANLRQNVRDESSVGGAITVSGLRKLSKRTMYNIEGFLTAMVRRILWRKMQFEPERFPVDVNFQVKGTMGMVARELEQQFMVNLLQFTDKGTPPYLLMLKAIFEQSSSPVKTEMVKAVDAMLQPDPHTEQLKNMLQVAEVQDKIETVRRTRAQTALYLAQGDQAEAAAMLNQIKGQFQADDALMNHLRVLDDMRKTTGFERQLDLEERKLEQGNNNGKKSD